LLKRWRYSLLILFVIIAVIVAWQLQPTRHYEQVDTSTNSVIDSKRSGSQNSNSQHRDYQHSGKKPAELSSAKSVYKDNHCSLTNIEQSSFNETNKRTVKQFIKLIFDSQKNHFEKLTTDLYELLNSHHKQDRFFNDVVSVIEFYNDTPALFCAIDPIADLLNNLSKLNDVLTSSSPFYPEPWITTQYEYLADTGVAEKMIILMIIESYRGRDKAREFLLTLHQLVLSGGREFNPFASQYWLFTNGFYLHNEKDVIWQQEQLKTVLSLYDGFDPLTNNSSATSQLLAFRTVAQFHANSGENIISDVFKSLNNEQQLIVASQWLNILNIRSKWLAIDDKNTLLSKYLEYALANEARTLKLMWILAEAGKNANFPALDKAIAWLTNNAPDRKRLLTYQLARAELFQQFDEMLAILTKLLNDSPNDMELNRQLMAYYISQDKLSIANLSQYIDLLEQADTQDPKRLMGAYARRARIYITMKQYDLAQQDFSSLLTLADGNVNSEALNFIIDSQLFPQLYVHFFESQFTNSNFSWEKLYGNNPKEKLTPQQAATSNLLMKSYKSYLEALALVEQSRVSSFIQQQFNTIIKGQTGKEI